MLSTRALLPLRLIAGCSKSAIDPASGASDASVAMVDVPAGTFTMGCNAAFDMSCNEDEKPAHKVTVHAFALDHLETTQREYQECKNAGACTSPTKEFDPAGHAGPRRVGHLGSSERVLRLARQTLGDGSRVGVGGPRIGRPPVPVGQRCADVVGSHPSAPLAAGVLDMGGNLWEWVNDFYDPAYYATSPSADPRGPACAAQHAKRGGSWQDSADRLRASRRWTHPQGSGAEDTGIRCAK